MIIIPAFQRMVVRSKSLSDITPCCCMVNSLLVVEEFPVH